MKTIEENIKQIKTDDTEVRQQARSWISLSIISKVKKTMLTILAALTQRLEQS